MAVIVKTNNPESLLASIKKEINSNTIDTWSVDNDGDFTHTPEQWINKAWFTPRIYAGELRFGILSPKDVKITTFIYGVYHGRFIEMLLNHFDDAFTQAYATSQLTEPDFFE